MQLNEINIENFPLVEVISSEILIHTTQDALDLLGEANFSNIILYDYNFEPDFFDLSTRKLGDVLQKFTNYKVKVAIIGNFETYSSKVLQEYIYESNNIGDFLFAPSKEIVLQRWKK